MKYKIKESQLSKLVQLKKDKNLVEEIISKVDRANKSLNESIIINEAVNDILNVYNKKGLINESIKELLIKSGKLSESQINRIKL